MSRGAVKTTLALAVLAAMLAIPCNAAPTITLTSPADGQIYYHGKGGGTYVYFTVKACDNACMRSMDIIIDGGVKKTVETKYNLNLKCLKLTKYPIFVKDGKHKITVRATNKKSVVEYSSSITIFVTKPSKYITKEVTTLPVKYELTAIASDDKEIKELRVLFGNKDLGYIKFYENKFYKNKLFFDFRYPKYILDPQNVSRSEKFIFNFPISYNRKYCEDLGNANICVFYEKHGKNKKTSFEFPVSIHDFGEYYFIALAYDSSGQVAQSESYSLFISKVYTKPLKIKLDRTCVQCSYSNVLITIEDPEGAYIEYAKICAYNNATGKKIRCVEANPSQSTHKIQKQLWNLPDGVLDFIIEVKRVTAPVYTEKRTIRIDCSCEFKRDVKISCAGPNAINIEVTVSNNQPTLHYVKVDVYRNMSEKIGSAEESYAFGVSTIKVSKTFKVNLPTNIYLKVFHSGLSGFKSYWFRDIWCGAPVTTTTPTITTPTITTPTTPTITTPTVTTPTTPTMPTPSSGDIKIVQISVPEVDWTKNVRNTNMVNVPS